MAKHKIFASRPLQILGHEDTVDAGTLLATIETDCEIGALLSALQFGGASIESEQPETLEPEVDPIRDAIVEALTADPSLTNKQVVAALATKELKTSINKVAAVRNTL